MTIRRRGRTIAATLLSAGTVTALLSTPATAAPGTQDLDWAECPAGSGVGPETVCAEITVPRDYDNPDAGTLDITMSKIPASGTAAEYQGVIAGNPGGPGGSALGMFAGDADVAAGTDAGKVLFPEQVRRQYDLLAVQPRGHAWAGDMDCAVEGIPGALTAQLGAGAVYQACEAAEPGLVGTITTENTARDLEVARQALGQDELNLYGVSYGGSLMSTYATVFPQHTGKTILDSSVAPSDRWFGLGANRLDDRQESLEAYFTWIAERDEEYGLGTTPLQVYQSWSDRVRTEVGIDAEVAPPAAKAGDLPTELAAHAELLLPPLNQVIDPAWRAKSAWQALSTGQPGLTAASPTYSVTIYGALYDENSWPQTAAWLRDGIPEEELTAVSEDEAELAGLSRQILAMPMVELSIVCNENRNQVRGDLVAPLIIDSFTGGDVLAMTENNIASGQACAGWPLPTPARDFSGAQLEHAPLILGYSQDNAVTGEAIYEVQETMGGEMIMLDGFSHGVLINDTDTVADEVTAYLS